jgi:hypothetical protein
MLGLGTIPGTLYRKWNNSWVASGVRFYLGTQMVEGPSLYKRPLVSSNGLAPRAPHVHPAPLTSETRSRGRIVGIIANHLPG